MNEATPPSHHGDLSAALLRAAEDIIERDGLPALTLRGVARTVGVSHAAPKNHFDDLTGLLSELAAIGFNRFAAALADAAGVAEADRSTWADPIGRAYVTFARAHPGMFALMFRAERLDATRPALRDATATARITLRQAVAASAPPDAPMPPLASAARGVAIWSLVHGFTILLLDGRLAGVLDALPPGEDVDTLLDAVLSSIRFPNSDL